jgi:hypothetical protein
MRESLVFAGLQFTDWRMWMEMEINDLKYGCVGLHLRIDKQMVFKLQISELKITLNSLCK